jgi:hypothetical protein
MAKSGYPAGWGCAASRSTWEIWMRGKPRRAADLNAEQIQVFSRPRCGRNPGAR